MNKNYTYFFVKWHKIYFLVCCRILIIYVCHEMKKVENRWSRLIRSEWIKSVFSDWHWKPSQDPGRVLGGACETSPYLVPSLHPEMGYFHQAPPPFFWEVDGPFSAQLQVPYYLGTLGWLHLKFFHMNDAGVVSEQTRFLSGDGGCF